MAAGTSAPTPSSPSPEAARPRSGKFIEYDRYIETQLRRTRRQVKGIDLAASLMLLAAGSMVYLLLAALADHWLVPGGLGFGGRVVCLGLFVGGALAYVALRLGPLVIGRINPVYAAQAIEQSRPNLKNSLINFLLLRSSRDALPQRIYEAIEEQAANGLSAAHVETAVDRSPLVKFMTILMVAVGALALYRIASPKNPFTSIRRVMAPWADISAPTRVAIEEILPGDADGYHDQHFRVAALVSGLTADEQVTVHYSTADGQAVDQRVRMSLPENGYRYQGELPAEAAGLQQDLEYWITAGDAISKRYKVTVLIAPAIIVDAIDYVYPAYSEQTARSVPRRGDISGIEGAQVTVRATATHDIQSADLDFDCNGQRDLAMNIDGRKASVRFPLVLKRGSDQPEHESYQLRFKNKQGHENPKPIRYAIEVIRDLPPEIAIVEPELKPIEETNLAAGGSLALKLTASDPDFKLADVRLHAKRGNEPLLDEALLAEPRGGPFERRYVFSSRTLKLKAGDVVTLWAAADDNKQPQANHAETPHYTLRIASPDGKRDQDQLASAETNKKSKDKPQNDQPNDKPNPGERQAGDEGQPGDKQPPESDQDRDRPDKSAKQKQDRRKPNDQQNGEEQSGEGGEGEKDWQGKPGEKQPRGDDKTDDGKADDGQPQSEEGAGDGRQNGKGDKASRKSSDERNGEEGGQEGSERVDPDKDAGRAFEEINKFFNDKQQDPKPQDDAGKQQPDGKSPGEKQAAEQRPSEKNLSDKGSADKDPSRKNNPSENNREQNSSENSPAEKNSSGGKPSPEKQERRQQGDKQTGEKSAGESTAEQQPGERGSQEKMQQPGKGEKTSQPRPGKEGQPSKPDGAGAQDEKSQGENPASDNKQGAGQKGTGEQGGERDAKEKLPSERQPGERRAGEKQPGETKPGEKQSGEKQPGEKQAGEPDPKDKGRQMSKEDETDEAQGTEQKPQAGKNPADRKGQGEKKPNEDDQQPGPGQSGGKEGEGKQQPKEKQSPEGGGQAGKTKSKDKAPQQTGGQGNDGQDKSMKPEEKGDGEKSPSEAAKVGDEEPKEAQGDQKSQPGKSAGQTKGQGEPNDKQNPDAKDPNQDVNGGDPVGEDRGKGGAGQAGGNKSPSPSPNDQNRPRDKQEKPFEKGRANTDEDGDSASASDRQSDSKSDKSGDLSGGGGKGGGQRSQSPGKGSAGQNTDADQGGGQSEQTGQGPKSDKAGDQVKGEKPSGGASSREKGPGSNREAGGSKPGGSDESPGENRPSQQPGDSNTEQAGGKPMPSAEGGHDVRQGNRSGNAPNNQGNGGLPGSEESELPPPIDDTSEPGGDDPNLEYTRKATDLALERLKDQLKKGEPDQELLDKLKWSREDVEAFVKRWDALKRSARSPGAQGDAAQEELDETLRSLGLHARGSSLSGGQKRGDQRRNLIESRRTAPPAEYADQYREFSKGISKAKK